MKRVLAGLLCAAILTPVLAGCRSKSGEGVPAAFDGETLKGWKITDASYELVPENGYAGTLLKSGRGYLSTGRVQPAYRITDGRLETERLYSAMETENYWRGLFFTSDAMQAEDGETVTANITAEVGSIAGIALGTDKDLNNGFAAVIHLAKQRVEIMRVNAGILTPLETYQDGVVTNSVHVETGGTYTLSVTLRSTGDQAYTMTVSVDGSKRLETTLSGYGVGEGHGNQVSLVVSDMKSSVENVKIGDKAVALDALRPSAENPQTVDDAFKGTVTSDSFKVKSRYLTFRAGGGKDRDNLKICLIDAKTGEVLFTETGSGSEEMTRRVWDMEAYKGRSCKVQVTDNLKSGHLNVDNFYATDELPLDTAFSLLSSQIGYSTGAVKKAYIRASGTPTFPLSSFTLRDFDTGESVYEGRVRSQGQFWESSWWELDFSDFQEPGRYVVVVGEGVNVLTSTAFEIGEAELVNASLLDTSLNQLDLRRSPGKLGWRDSSTDELRELHAQVMTIHTMLDILDTQSDWLSAYNRARVLDNIEYGLQYILKAQERTDDPKTDGRFIHDLYPSQFSADKLRSWFDTTYAMSALARSLPVLKERDAALAEKVKEAFDVSFNMCVLRPYHLPEELDIEGPGGLNGVEGTVRQLYYLREMSWTFDYKLRTRDKMMFLSACTYMAKAVGASDPRYFEQAKSLAKEISALQFTDYKNPIDGAFGCFYEFENSTEAMMLEWIQAFNLMLGNQTPTDLSPYMTLLELAPDDPDAAMWMNTLKIYADGYVKPTAGLTPLGIYPIAAYNNTDQRGVKFFQTLSHGASSHFGFMGRNIQKLAQFFNDAALQDLAQNNVQFQAGLNPGFPTSPDGTAWKSYSLLYLVGSRSFSGCFNGGAYTPPIGSGFNGFSASTQFTVEMINQTPDLPLGILDESGNYQFNEDYIPHGMGYASGIAAVDSPVKIPVEARFAGQPVEAEIRLSGAASGTQKTGADGTAVLTGIRPGGTLTLDISYQDRTITRTLTVIAGESAPVTVDFAENIDTELTVPETLSGEGQGTLKLTNTGTAAVTVDITLLADGANLGDFGRSLTLQPGETAAVEIALTAGDKSKPYLVYAYLALPHHAKTVTGTGRIA